MRIVLVVCVFPPETGVSGTCAYDLAVELTRRGHETTVVTGRPCRPVGRFSRVERRAFSRRSVDPAGFTVLRTGAFCSPGQTMAQKLVENLSFGLSSAVRVAFSRADVAFVNTWPIFAQGMCAAVCRARRIPLVLNVQDVHPEAACAAGKLASTGRSMQWLRQLDGWTTRSAAATVTISSRFAELYRSTRHVPQSRLFVVPNWGNAERVVPRPRIGAPRTRWGIADDKFVCLFAGNVGEVAGVESIVATADLLRDDRRIAFVVAGDGSRRAACEARAQALGLDNIRFHYPLGDEEFNDVQGAADVLLLPTRGAGAMTSAPSKLISYLFAERPVLAAVDDDSESAQVLRAAECGVRVAPESPVAMAQAIDGLSRRPDALRKMGIRGRRYAERHFSRDSCVGRLSRLLEAVAAGNSLCAAELAEAA